MFREKEICDAIRTAYLHLFPDKKERKRALSRLDLELVAQGVRYRGEIVLAYQTSGSHERALDYYGPELFPQRGCCIYQKTVQSHSTQVDAACIRELWLLGDGRFVEVSGVTTKYRSAYERFSTCYRTVHHLCREFTTYREDLDEIVELIVETVCAKRKTTRIAGADFPHEVVRSRFLKLDSSHIEFVMECLHNNTTEVRNMKQYLLTVLFNAPTTISNHYTAQVNHDMYAGGC